MRRSIRTVPGFTLVEMLIAVGAFALIALGLTMIFDSTAKTVSGGRRVSAMTEYAALLESQFRADFQAMTRDGFLVIRNEYANDAEPVPLHGDDRSPRRRRVDELMFFVKTPVSSAREALAQGFNATSDEAAVYYGHGQGRRDLGRNSRYRRPDVRDTNIEPASRLGVDAPGNPNRSASSWNLLRHVTVLAQFGGSVAREFGNGPGLTPLPFGFPPARVRDGEHQIGLQPAASSLFRRIAGFLVPPRLSNALRPGGVLASGIVDVATTDLAEIREIVTTVSKFPNEINSQQALETELNGRTSGGGPGAIQLAAQYMQAWMDDALPANSMARSVVDRSRMRAERSPPDFFDAVRETNELRGAIRRADQMALASSVFIPSCTGFIVEWTFGMVEDGQMIWHGLDRWIDLDGDGRMIAEEMVSRPYRGGMAIPLMIRGPRGLVTPNPGNPNAPVSPAGLDAWPVNPVLIHGRRAVEEELLTSYFGYFDPTFNPDLRNNAGNRTPDGDIEDIGDALSPTLPWAWPSLIRITLTLADPIDPTFEQTFQFVFETPGNPVY